MRVSLREIASLVNTNKVFRVIPSWLVKRVSSGISLSGSKKKKVTTGYCPPPLLKAPAARPGGGGGGGDGTGTCGGEQRPETSPFGGAEGLRLGWAPVLTHGARALAVQLVRWDAHVCGGRLRQGVSVVAEERHVTRRSKSHLSGLKTKTPSIIINI